MGTSSPQELIKKLRSMTSAGILDCKKALDEANLDLEKAIEILRKKDLAKAVKKATREASEGIIGSYVHTGGKIAVMVEVNCETDFVARTDDFNEFAKNIAMHIAALNPGYLDKESVPQEALDKEREILKEQLGTDPSMANKPDNIKDKIIDGRLKKFYEENCLLHQAYVKEPTITVEDYRKSIVGKLGENIQIKRFVRYQLGEDA